MRCRPQIQPSLRLHTVLFVVLVGSLSNDDGDGYENVTGKVNSRWLNLYRVYFISFNSSNVGKCLWSWILKDCIKVQGKENKIVVLCSRPQQNVKSGVFHIVVVQRRQTEKYHTKKRDARVKLLFCQTKPIGLLPFSMPSPSSLLSLIYPRDLREPVYRILFIYLPVYLFVYIFIYLHVFMKKKSALDLSVDVIEHDSTIWGHHFYISSWRRDRHFTWSSEPRQGLAACRTKTVPSFLS